MSELLTVHSLLALCLGVGLASACGFRVFVPPLVLGVAKHFGAPLAESVPDWLGSWWALAILSSASLVEVIAYYVPWLDNALDSVATPLALIAGTLVTAGASGHLDPAICWTLAIVAGGGAASITQTATVVTRAVSSATTGGLANFLVATLEGLAALLLSVLTVLLAPLAALFVVASGVWLVRVMRRRRARKLQMA